MARAALAKVVVDGLVLPWPPSVNHYWGWRGRRCFVGRRGREHRAAVAAAVMAQKLDLHLTDRLRVEIIADPPDNRRRDIDNLCKVSLDSMQHAGVFCDDSQVDELEILRGDVIQRGQVVVSIFIVGAPR